MAVHFFCDHCGTEVPLHIKRCPACKRPFISVQCPRCRFEGEAEQFLSGCPICGYKQPEAKPPPRTPKEPGGGLELPPWLYRVLSLFLGLALLVLLYLLLR